MPKKITAAYLKSLPAKTSQAYKNMTQSLGKSIPADDVDHFDKTIFAEMASSHWDLAKTRKPGHPKIAIYCPIDSNDQHRKTIIDVVSDDNAFLVDSIAARINESNFLIDLLLHPVLYAKYDTAGKLLDISEENQKGYLRQSHIHIHIKQTISSEDMASLEAGLYEALADVYVANQDWRDMLDRLQETRVQLATSKTAHSEREVSEYCAFLDYLHDNNFTLLGYREYEFVQKDDDLKSKTVRGRSLGLLRDDIKPAYISETEEGLPRNLQEVRKNLPAISVSKTNRMATVHRRVPMDAIAVKVYDKSGKVIGERLFLGLFTSVTYSRSVSDVPYLREKVNEVMEMSNFLPGSHDRKALRHILEKYPRDELFQIPPQQLFEIGLSILRLQERQRIALFLRQDLFGRYISCLVYVPRDRFGTSLRKTITRILERELNGKCTNFYTTLDDSVFARVMFIINVSQKNPPSYNTDHIESLLREAGQTWAEQLTAALTRRLTNEDEMARLSLKYSEAFPIAYTSRYSADQAVFDIYKIEDALQDESLQLDLYQPADLSNDLLRLKVYNPHVPLNLSDVMPIIENMGLRAIAELPFEITPQASGSVWVHDFLLENPAKGSEFILAEVKGDFEKCFTKVWYKTVESDPLNRLVLTAKLNWHETVILRSLVRYMKQACFPFSQGYVETALTQHPAISRRLVDLFRAMHDPANGKKSEILAADCEDDINKKLEKVESLDQDRILRYILTLIRASLRTNYFQRDEEKHAKSYLSIKFDSKRVPGLPEPRPYREIFVYSPRVEAIHLRSDKVARGGLRWSDRHEDFRTEVLGLLKAQMVKNAVIVPMGSKGGFVVKTPMPDRASFQKEGIECYKIFIRGLLDITDNLKGEKVIPPRDVVRLDGDDPYLVVAADKGTASFSDIANSLSLEYGFWLGDAFASGGSAGYDHKKMGITARGAWESVKLHFRQLNHDTQTQEFDVIGVGDMGGDVFGNGMLLSEKICLVGAFNHVHIFCDPEPDAAKSYAERKRLFEGVLGWDHYDVKKLSRGGRIFNRSEKELELTPEIQARFDIDKKKVTPQELIRAMLKARTDLLWFGGIGTYVKSSKETDADVGDKGNDALRVNACDLRAKVMGEGANLAITQRGRIEFAEGGGRLNTDFVDNSGGVDSSDHEVNIKIALSEVMSQPAHKMTLKSRNTLLEKMTDDVAAHVLRHNYQQAQAISLIELQAAEYIQLHEELMEDMERTQGLNRELEGLPSKAVIEERIRTGKGLTRPELCILNSYAKISFTQDLLKTNIPDSEDMQYWLVNYFPKAMRTKYEKEIKRHKLRREIISTMIANALVNRMGPAFVKARAKKTGASSADIAKSFILVREAFELRKLWDSIEALDNKVPAQVQLKAMRDIAELSKHAVTWFLTRLGRNLEIETDNKTYRQGIQTLLRDLDTVLNAEMLAELKQRTQAGVLDGLPEDIAYKIAMMPILSSACDIIKISTEEKTDLLNTAQIYFQLGQQFHFGWLRQQARYMSSDDAWHGEAVSNLIEQLYGSQAGLTVRILRECGGKSGKNKDCVQVWFKKRQTQIEQLEPFFMNLRRGGTLDLSMLVVAEQRLRNLYGG